MQTSIRLFLIAAFAVAALGAQPIVPARAADDTIVFGSAVSLTGSLNKEGKLTQEGYDFWVNYVNAHGGLKVGGKRYKVAIKYYDDESKPANAAQLAERLIDQDHVNFILGPYGSGTTFTVAQMVERKKIVMVEGNGAAEKVFNQGFKYTFGVLSPAKRYLERVIEMALTIKPRPKTLAISAASDAFSLEVQQGVVEYAKAHGIDVVYANKYPDTATDVSSVISAIKASNPDLILNAGHLQDALLIQKGLKEQNVLAKAYAYSVGPDTPDFTNSLGRDANAVFGAAQWSESVRYKADRGGFYKTAPDYANAFAAAYHHRPDYHNAESTAACLAFQDALQDAGALDSDKVRDALSRLNVITFYGLIKFDSRGLNVYKPMVVNQIQNGKLLTVYPPVDAVAKLVYPAPPWNQR